MIKNKFILGILLLIFGLSFSGKSQEIGSKEKSDRANEILSLAKQSVYGKSPKDKLKSLSLIIINNTREGQNTIASKEVGANESVKELDDKDNKDFGDSSEREISTEILFEFPNKIKWLSTSQKLNSSIGTSINTSVSLNAEKYKNQITVSANGKPFDTTKIPLLANLNLFGDSKKLTDAEIVKKRESFLDDFWLTIFPILLETPWTSAATFEYAGKAEAEGTKADIIDVKSLGTKKIQLFFDEKSHLLLMMTVKNEVEKDKSKVNEDYKYFYSNYENVDGILVAKKITVEGNTKFVTDKSVMGYKIKGRNTESSSQIEIKGIKINPTFKANTFLIADEKPADKKK